MTAGELTRSKAAAWQPTTYRIAIGTWAEMTSQLLRLVLADTGSVRAAAGVKGVVRPAGLIEAGS